VFVAYGTPCLVFDDLELAASLESGKHLLQHAGGATVDRYDARLLLDNATAAHDRQAAMSRGVLLFIRVLFQPKQTWLRTGWNTVRVLGRVSFSIYTTKLQRHLCTTKLQRHLCTTKLQRHSLSIVEEASVDVLLLPS